MKKFIVPLLSFLILAAGYLCLKEHESRSVEKIEFLIDAPYLAVVKGLASKNSLEKIVEENDGRVTGKNWESFQVEVPKRILRIREYQLDGVLKFNVEKKDPDLGELRLPFAQEMHLDDHVLHLRTTLQTPQKQVVSYDKEVEISPHVEDEGAAQKTHVSIRSELTVRKTIPFFFGKTMDEKVANSNRKDLERFKGNIIEAAGQKPLLTIIRQGRTM